MEAIVICNRGAGSLATFGYEIPDHVIYVPDKKWDVANVLKIHSAPFGLLLDKDGVNRGKGIPSTAAEFDWFSRQIAEFGHRDKDNLVVLTKDNVVTQNGGMRG